MYHLPFYELGVSVDCQLAASKFIGLIGMCDFCVCVCVEGIPLQWLNRMPYHCKLSYALPELIGVVVRRVTSEH